MKINVIVVVILSFMLLLVSCTVKNDIANDSDVNNLPVANDSVASNDDSNVVDSNVVVSDNEKTIAVENDNNIDSNKVETIESENSNDDISSPSQNDDQVVTTIVKKEAHLKLVSTPSDADVYINGELVGKTPFDEDISIGYIKVEVKKYSYVDYLITFAPNKDDSKSISIKLIQDVGFIYTDSTPKRARVFLDGKYKGNAPVNFNTTFGEHTVKMLMDGYQNYTETIIVEPKKIVSVTPTLIAIN